jgi:hypothetical protein
LIRCEVVEFLDAGPQFIKNKEGFALALEKGKEHFLEFGILNQTPLVSDLFIELLPEVVQYSVVNIKLDNLLDHTQPLGVLL